MRWAPNQDYSSRGLHFGVYKLVRDVFIETGTFRGDTLMSAVAAGFRQLYSMECCERLYRAACRRFANCPHVRLHLGSSPDILPKIMDPALATTFWLDARYQGYDRDEFDLAVGECPLLLELAAIRAVPWKTPPVIVIDDAAIFRHGFDHLGELGMRFDPCQWPSIEQVRQALPAGYEKKKGSGLFTCLKAT